MVQADVNMEGEVTTFESYMSRYEDKPIYYHKLQDFATNGRCTMETRGKALNLAVMKAKATKKIG